MRRSTQVIITGVVIVITISLVGAAWYLQQHRPQPARQTDAARFQAEYPRVAADNRFVYARDVAVLDMLEHGTGVVFLGYTISTFVRRVLAGTRHTKSWWRVLRLTSVRMRTANRGFLCLM